MNRFPSIKQYKSAVRYMRKHCQTHTKLNFVGTVKLHGTNGSVIVSKDKVTYYSKNRKLTVENDNFDFATSMSQHEAVFKKMAKYYSPDGSIPITFFGEWAGKGIQKGVAISELPKSFYLFSIGFGEKIYPLWALKLTYEFPVDNIFNITQDCVYTIEVDVNNPQLITEKIKKLVEEVEKECPIAKKRGVTGIGEGIVWGCRQYPTNQDLWFKAKGKKHSASRVKEFVAVDPEVYAKIYEFVGYAVTHNRLMQGIQYLEEMGYTLEKKNTGHFMRWVCSDIAKEESDTIEASGLNKKKTMKEVSIAVSDWWFAYLDNHVDETTKKE